MHSRILDSMTGLAQFNPVTIEKIARVLGILIRRLENIVLFSFYIYWFEYISVKSSFDKNDLSLPWTFVNLCDAIYEGVLNMPSKDFLNWITRCEDQTREYNIKNIKHAQKRSKAIKKYQSNKSVITETEWVRSIRFLRRKIDSSGEEWITLARWVLNEYVHVRLWKTTFSNVFLTLSILNILKVRLLGPI